MKKIIWFLSIIIIMSLSVVYTIKSNSKTINKNKAYFIIQGKETLPEIAQRLGEKGIIKSSGYFKLYAKLLDYDNSIKPGKYILENGLTLRGLLEKFKGGKSDFEVVTIPEGYSLYEIASKLEGYKLVDKSSFMQLSLKDIDKGGLINIKNKPYYDMEGYLFPDTYYIPKNLSEKEIAGLLFSRFMVIFNDEYRKRAEELKLSLPEVITIASLIEKEAANDEERRTISGVIYNRIKKGMPLQIDAAVIYANTKGEPLIKNLSKSQLRFDSKYNTYLYKGLPIGPIASPGKPSIEAALYPESHDYLYYVLNPAEDKHVFSKTYEEHIRNVNKYLR